MKGLKRLQAGGILLRELRGIRQALERLADVQEATFAAAHPTTPSQARAPDAPEQDPVWVTTVDSQLAADLADIELRLTGAKGMPPTEDEILAAYEAQHTEPDDPRRLSVLEAHQEGRVRHE